MTHLFVDLYDRVGDKLPCCTLNDHDVNNRRYFYDLHRRGVAEHVTRVVIRRGDEYRTGDHIRLFDKSRADDSDTIAIDPANAADVDLNDVIFNAQGFADRAAAVLIVTNPNPDSSFRLRISLYDQVGQKLPSLIFYDWEYAPDVQLADLNHFHFANKAAFIRIEKGPNYQAGDQVILWETLARDSRTHQLDPGDYDLKRLMLEESGAGSWSFIQDRKSWAKTVSGLELDLQPRVIRH